MIEVFEKAPGGFKGEIYDTISLDHQQREKGRLKIHSVKGEEVRLFLERGHMLQKGDVLQSSCKRFFKVALAPEALIVASTSSWKDFSRACYHLGNRHTRVQIGECWLRFLEDSVLISLMAHLGLTTEHHHLPFEPESGAYGHGHAGKAQHRHSHENSHDHHH